MLVYVEPTIEKFNKYIADGSIGKKIDAMLSAAKPEAIYFTNNNGRRSWIMIVDVPKSSAVPSIAEPFFLQLDAKVEFHICMTPEDLGNAGLDEIGKKWG
ncbi:MAG TPA: hypothetical protein VNI20_04770 [Fimbriimonadaceae bacterium]|nr:hypothetical protein [Fimbriimonadaceae bacterium]